MYLLVELFSLIRIDHVFPPVLRNAVKYARAVGQVAKPPQVMFSYVAVAPFVAVNQTGLTLQFWELVPGIATAGHPV